MSRRRKRRGEAAEVETAAMNDIMFFLFLFFLIASTQAAMNAITVTLPSAKKNVANVVQVKKVVVTVDKDHNIFIDKTPVGSSLDFNDKKDQLMAQLNELKNKYKNKDNPEVSDLNIVLRLDRNLTVQDEVDIMQIGATLGVKMVLGIDKPAGK